MRLDRLRQGMLGPGPLVPGMTADTRALFGSPAQETPTVNRTVGDVDFQGGIRAVQSMAQPDPIMAKRMGLPPLPPMATSEITDTIAKGALNTAMRPPGPRMNVQSPAMRSTLGGLSDITQGKQIGRMVPETPPLDVVMGPMEEGDDLPTRPPLDMQPVDPSYGDLFKRMRPY